MCRAGSGAPGIFVADRHADSGVVGLPGGRRAHPFDQHHIVGTAVDDGTMLRIAGLQKFYPNFRVVPVKSCASSGRFTNCAKNEFLANMSPEYREPSQRRHDGNRQFSGRTDDLDCAPPRLSNYQRALKNRDLRFHCGLCLALIGDKPGYSDENVGG